MRAILLPSFVSAILLPSFASAQTSGTLTTQTAQNWSTAFWTITSGSGTYPDVGGVATWGTVTNTVVGTVAPSATTITLDVPITLSGITWNSPFSMTLAGSATNTLGLSTTGATFSVPLSIANTPTLTQLANIITAPITGGGTGGITKTGPGTMTLGATVASTYTGGTNINGGSLIIDATAAIGDSILGAIGAGNDLSMNGGSLFVAITGGWTTNRNLTLNAGGGTIITDTAATINGVVSGSGSLNNVGFASGVGLTLTNVNTYNGATISSSSPVSLLTLSGNGSIALTSGLDLAGTLAISDSTTNVNSRLGTAPVTSHGATITLTGSATAATTEAPGILTLAAGVNTITVTPNAAQPASLTFAGMTRQNNATLYVRGTSLGATPGAGVAQIGSTASPGTLVGGAGAAGSTAISILPWAAGNVSAAATTSSSFVTWNSGTGQFRPLNTTTEYSALTSGEADTNNTTVAAATAIAVPTTVNSVLVTGTGTLLSGAGGLNIASGAILYSPASTTAGTISANINFGAAEGVISSTGGAANSVTAGLIVSGVITGTGGVTLNSIINSDITLTNAGNSYTGPTTLLGGLTIVSGTIASGANSIFGADTSPIVVNASNSVLNGILASAATTMSRPLSIVGSPNSNVFLVTNGSYALTLNGNVTIASGVQINFYSVAAGSAANGLIINGNISGAGGISDNALTTVSFITLNGNNTYTGPTNIETATYVVGSNTAFGNSTVYFSSTGKIQSADTTTHTIANNLFLAATSTYQGAGGLNFTGSVNLNGTRSLTVSDTAAAGVTFSGVVSNGALTKTNTGILSLNSPTGNTYTGGTVLGSGAGTLNVNNTSGSGTGPGTVSIGGTTAANRSTLSGAFILSGATTDSGALTPGNFGTNAIGSDFFGSSLTFTANSLITEELASSSSADQINVAGALTLGGATFAVNTIGSYQAQLGDSFELVTWGSVAGTATINVTGATLADPVNTMWDTSSFLTNGTIAVVPVPEPSTVLLMVWGASMAGATMIRRRRRSK